MRASPSRLVATLVACDAPSAAVALLREQFPSDVETEWRFSAGPESARRAMLPLVEWLVGRLLHARDAPPTREVLGACGIRADVLLVTPPRPTDGIAPVDTGAVLESAASDAKAQLRGLAAARAYLRETYLLAHFVLDSSSEDSQSEAQTTIESDGDNALTTATSSPLDFGGDEVASASRGLDTLCAEILADSAALAGGVSSAAALSPDCGLERDAMTASRARKTWAALGAPRKTAGPARRRQQSSATSSALATATVLKQFEREEVALREAMIENAGVNRAVEEKHRGYFLQRAADGDSSHESLVDEVSASLAALVATLDSFRDIYQEEIRPWTHSNRGQGDLAPGELLQAGLEDAVHETSTTFAGMSKFPRDTAQLRARLEGPLRGKTVHTEKSRTALEGEHVTERGIWDSLATETLKSVDGEELGRLSSAETLFVRQKTLGCS